MSFKRRKCQIWNIFHVRVLQQEAIYLSPLQHQGAQAFHYHQEVFLRHNYQMSSPACTADNQSAPSQLQDLPSTPLAVLSSLPQDMATLCHPDHRMLRTSLHTARHTMNKHQTWQSLPTPTHTVNRRYLSLVSKTTPPLPAAPHTLVRRLT